MALLTSVSLAQARTLGAALGLEIADVEPLTLGSVNSNFRLRDAAGRPYFGRLYEEQPRSGAETEVRLLTLLADGGLPVVRPVTNAGGEAVLELEGKPFAIFPWVAGDWLCLSQVTKAHCFAVGTALAGVHRASPAVGELSRGRFQPQDMLLRLRSVESQCAPELQAAIEHVRGKYAQYEPLRVTLPEGVCHGDLFRDNVLWQGAAISALLDFESAYWGSFAYDLMVTALAWCFTDRLLGTHVRALFEGYESVRRLSSLERSALETEGALACLRFATSRITDFELRTPAGARPARDFRRFFARLESLEAGHLRRAIEPGRATQHEDT
ncbi:MAG TPA: homoserine kinase [Polyangiaceae bacterium]|nr:homoserine kinase [Polyangiaceae bacterium]